MARGGSLINATLRLGRAMAADQRRAQNAAIRQHNAQIRYQTALNRQHERDQKLAEKQQLLQEKENAIQYAIDKTTESEELRTLYTSILKSSIESPIKVNWNIFKKFEKFPQNQPWKPELKQDPREINPDDYSPEIKFLDKIFKKRLQKKLVEAKSQLDKAMLFRQEEISKNIITNNKIEKEFESQLSLWTERKNAFEAEQKLFNENVDAIIESFSKNESNGIEFYFDAILDKLTLPELLLTNWELEYNAETKILIIDYDFPDIEIIPNLKQMKYVTTRKEFTETYIKEKEIDQIYDDILLQLSLRITHDVYLADLNNQIDSIVFNGIHTGVNKSTGIEETKCILSLQTKNTEFKQINIQNVDPKSCFMKLKGVAGAKLSDFIPIAPIIAMDKEDSRFVEGIDVSGMINGMNLAAMDWESFEHLIRQLFEKEFATNGSEIKITQASRDGGVDAVMFDPDPIRGGKYIIQAKRYTNVVGVSAVRDLYGTLMNEGAVKGILVTTANYGADSYEFAKDKPITLINGNNLLHMLQKHGYQARIDIDEAKKLMHEV